jgi:hypothetical protein
MASTPNPDPAGADPLVVEETSEDRFTSRARPAFLYVMYALLLGAFPMAAVAAAQPQVAATMTRAIGAYLAAIPEPLYALFGTGYLGYTVVREWGKAQAPK